MLTDDLTKMYGIEESSAAAIKDVLHAYIMVSLDGIKTDSCNQGECLTRKNQKRNYETKGVLR